MPSKKAQSEREFLITRGVQLARLITKLEPYACTGECTDHLMWSCEVVAIQPDDTEHHMVMAGALYPDGGWTADILEREVPDYEERMAFVPSLNLLAWEVKDGHGIEDDRDTIQLKLRELPSLMAGAVPNN